MRRAAPDSHYSVGGVPDGRAGEATARPSHPPEHGYHNRVPDPHEILFSWDAPARSL